MKKIFFKTLIGAGTTLGVASLGFAIVCIRYVKEYESAEEVLTGSLWGTMCSYFDYCESISKGFKDRDIRAIKYMLSPTMFGWFCRNLAD